MGVGYKDKTLREMLDEKDRLFAETGCIYGLKKLELVENDPVTLMKFQMRLVAACTNARETAKLVSASPVALQMGEVLFMVATAEGDVVSSSHGLIGHIQCIPFIVRSMIELGFENTDGIREGDIFSTNDPLYGSPHGSDCYTLIPVFYDGELISWAVGFNHIMEVGGIVPGNLSALSPNAFTDGFLYPPMKTGEDFRQHQWWELLWMRRTRMGGMNILDDKMRVAGAMAIRGKVLEAVEEFGADYFRKATKEILERERRQYIETIKTQAVPGKYQTLKLTPVRYKGTVGKLFPNSDRDWLVHMPMETTIESDGTLTPDLEGLTSEAEFHCNMFPHGTKAMASLGLWPMFAHTATTNTALAYMTDYKIPLGSMSNPMNPFTGTSMGTGVLGAYAQQYHHVFSYAYFARGFLEECFARSPNVAGYGIDGVFGDGERWAGGNFSLIGGDSTGGQPYKDGEPCLAAITNPESDIAETELYEFYEPTGLNIGRKLVPNYCAHGKYRGGLGMTMCQLITQPGQHLTMAVFSSTSTETGTSARGWCGGYPGLGTVCYFLHDTNMKELIEKGLPYPRDFVEAREMLKAGTLKAGSVELYPADSPNVPCKDGDLFILGAHANSGWGDPVERGYAHLEEDLHYGWLTADVVEKIYGAISDGDGKIKVSESDVKREEMKKKRAERSVDGKEWWKEERQKLLQKQFDPDVYAMYADCMKYQKFRDRMMSVWQLPEDYQL